MHRVRYRAVHTTAAGLYLFCLGYVGAMGSLAMTIFKDALPAKGLYVVFFIFSIAARMCSRDIGRPPANPAVGLCRYTLMLLGWLQVISAGLLFDGHPHSRPLELARAIGTGLWGYRAWTTPYEEGDSAHTLVNTQLRPPPRVNRTQLTFLPTVSFSQLAQIGQVVLWWSIAHALVAGWVPQLIRSRSYLAGTKKAA